VMKKYHDLGTAENIVPLNTFGGLPTRNLTTASFEHAAKISGETFARQYLGRRLACSHCPVGCIHIAALREPYEDVSYFYKTSMISYDYEPIYALGTMLGISKPADFLKLMDRVEEAWGVDAMSLGVILAWATEAFQRGLITTEETRGVRLKWGDARAYIKAGGYLIDQPNDFYRALARGVEYAASVYGGEEFALAFGGNEMPGYHTGPGAHLGVLIGARHSHLDNAGYSLDQKILIEKELEPEAVIDALLAEEQWRQILSSLVICFFARGIYSPELVTRLLAIAGVDLTADDLQRIGRKIHTEKFRFKVREGFTFDALRLPARIFETASPVSGLERQYLEKALAYAQETIRKELDAPE
ncbi:MAG: aldehyde ferredoxin oxidoreductase C-terminal domain-containing protein, partial [Deltaproteobacteria bacterium]|nr:aldehyde ferredoxin oxidoreductase C-terminal domain-containing protein [Deltaproteobacteria bacterium]